MNLREELPKLSKKQHNRWLREIDALVAEHIMGYDRGYWSNFEQKQIDIGWFDEYTRCDQPSGRTEYFQPIENVPWFSSRIQTAWIVAEKEPFRIAVAPATDGWWKAIKGKHMYVPYEMLYGRITVYTPRGAALNILWQEAPTMPLAVCLAALSARGLKIPNFPTD